MKSGIREDRGAPRAGPGPWEEPFARRAARRRRRCAPDRETRAGEEMEMSSRKMMGEWARIRRAAMGLIGALSLALVGCGGNDVKVAEKNDALRVPAEQPTTVATVASTPAESPVREEPETIASADSLAPEIALEVESRQVRPGEAVEVS